MDGDPGHDDAFAMMLGVQHLDVLGFTAVAGNCTVDKAAYNALRILDTIGRADIPVFRGQSCPLVVPLVTAPNFHGESGLDGPILPPPRAELQKERAADFIIDTAMSVDGLSIIATGPLTNIATALNQEPRIARRIREISLMGGSVTYGNWTPSAEFNIFVDPEAAYRVFNSGIHIKMSGLNITQQACITPREFDRISAVTTKAGRFAKDLLTFFMASSMRIAGIPGADLHDAVAAAWFIKPELITSAAMHITVELRGQYTRGMTVCDYRHLRSDRPDVDLARDSRYKPHGETPNAEAGLELDFEGFIQLIVDTLKAYN